MTVPTLPNRKAVRARLQTLLSDELVTVQTLVKSVLAYPKKNIQGDAPLVSIESAGFDVPVDAGVPSPIIPLFFIIHVFVLYLDEASSWTEANSEDMLDDIAKAIGGVIELYSYEDESAGALWRDIEQPERSRIDIYIEGQEYRHEMIPIVVNAYNTG